MNVIYLNIYVIIQLVFLTNAARYHENQSDVNIVAENDADNGETEDFIPTKNWQRLKPGQAIPAGLHVRLSMKTGEREAKLLEEETPTELAVTYDSDDDIDEHHTLSRELEKSLKELRTSHDSEETQSSETGNIDKMKLKHVLQNLKHDELKERPHKFKSMDELKEGLKAMNSQVQTDFEILTDLFKRYQEDDLSTEHKLLILEDLEYYVHQVDNAQYFTDLGGFAVLTQDLNNTGSDVRASVAYVIGSAAQSNPRVQREMLQLNVIPKLITLLQHEAALDVRSKCLYALAACIRNLPRAQLTFETSAGLQVLKQLFTEHGTDKLRVKVIALMTDLVREQMQQVEDAKSKGELSENFDKTQMKTLNIVCWTCHVETSGWCDLIPQLLDQSEHDTREKTLIALTTLQQADTCLSNHTFPTGMLLTLKRLQNEYRNLVNSERTGANNNDNDTDDGYFEKVLHLINDLVNSINESHHLEL